MTQQIIDIGDAPNDGTGDTLRNAFDKTNDNFDEIYAKVGAGDSVVASAATTDIGGEDNDVVRISGTTTITSFGSEINRLIYVTFEDALRIKHNATSLICPNGSQIKTAAGDGMIVKSDSSGNWRVLGYFPANYPSNEIHVLNGKFDVWQENTSYTPIASTVTFVADGWKVRRSSAADYTVTQQTGFSGSDYCIRLQRTNGTSDTAGLVLAQQIPSNRCKKLQGKTVWLSFDVRVGANYSGTTLTVSVATGTGTDEAFSPGVGTFPTGNVSTSIDNGDTPTTSASRYICLPVSIPTNATEIGWRIIHSVTGTAGAADYIEVTNVDLCDGPYARSMFSEAPAITLARCKRRYRKSFLQGTVPAQNVGIGTGEKRANCTATGAVSSLLCDVGFDVDMEATPAVTLYNPAAANGQVRNVTDSADCSSSAAANITTRKFDITFTGNAGAAVNEDFRVHWVADARL